MSSVESLAVNIVVIVLAVGILVGCGLMGLQCKEQLMPLFSGPLDLFVDGSEINRLLLVSGVDCLQGSERHCGGYVGAECRISDSHWQ